MVPTSRHTVFSYGLFSLAAQVVLFRQYLAAFGDQDLSVGVFVAASFLWMAAGVEVGRRLYHPIAAELAVLMGVPAVGLQYGVTVLVGGIQAVAPTLVPPFHELLIRSLIVTAPASVVTGWALRQMQGPVGRDLFASGAAGALLGGLVATVLLGQGVSDLSILIVLVVMLCGSAVWSAFRGPWSHPRATQVTALTCLLLIVGTLPLRVDLILTKAVRQYQWHRAQPQATWAGAFVTSQGEYLYGADEGRWVVVRNGRTFETIGDHRQAGRVAAMALAQNFSARRILVVGDGLSVCEAFLKSRQVTAVEWFHPDRQYIPALLSHLPGELRLDDARFRLRTDDIRQTLGNKPEEYDIVVVNLAANINASLHRYVSAEFFTQVKKALTPTGLLVLGVPREAHARDLESGYLGAWVKTTLDSVFTQTILVPQQRMFFLAADVSFLRVSPTSLATRFSLLEDAPQILPPEELESVYQPDKAVQALDACGLVSLPTEELRNTDRSPSYPLCHLLLMMERSGVSVLKPVRSFLQAGPILAMLGVVLLGLVRAVYALRTMARGRRPFEPGQGVNVPSEVRWILGCSTAAGVGLLVVTVNACRMQGGLGALSLGWMVSLFAGGCATAAFVVARMLPSPETPDLTDLRRSLWALLGGVVVQAAGLAAAGFWIGQLSVNGVGAVCAGAGLICGALLVLGAGTMRICGRDIEAPVPTAVGAAGGALLLGVLLGPLWSVPAVCYVGAAVALAAAAVAGVAPYEAARPGPRCVPHPWLAPVAYGLFGAALCLVAGTHVVRFIETSRTSVADSAFIEPWVKGNRVTTKTASPAGGAKGVTYQEVWEGSRLKGYIFRSQDLTGAVYGYGGPMAMVMFTEPNGTLLDFRLTRSNETPSYMARIRDWLGRLKGKTLFDANPLAGVNTVTGATYSSRAVLALLRNSGRQFAAAVLAQGQAAPAAAVPWTHRIDWRLVAWGAALPLAFAAIWHGRRWSRLVVLAYTASVSGFWLNRQFSTDQVIRLLNVDNILGGAPATLLLLLGVPLLIVLVGNIYCGYLCPFGAVQELLSLILPARCKPKLSRPVMGAARYLKYGTLFVVVGAVFAAGDQRLLALDPLTAFFSREFWSSRLTLSTGLVIAWVVLGAGLLVTRLWCRYLCPTGAFLSLFNLGAWLQRFLPAKKFGRCEFGLSGCDHLDCIHCDRCRYPSAPVSDSCAAGAGRGADAATARD